MVLRATLRASAILAVGLLGGCEAIVGDSLPSTIDCSGDLASSCPVGQECIAGTCKTAPSFDAPSIIIFDAGHEAAHVDAFHVDARHDTGHDAAPPPVDAGRDVGVSGALGDTCDPTSSNCGADLFCSDTANLPGLGFAPGAVCSRTCCTSSDCGGDNVCYPTAGGNYCITATIAARCASSCGTSCCTDGTCSSGSTYCAFGEAAGGSAIHTCEAPDAGDLCLEDPSCTGGASAADDCYEDSDCNDGVCYDPLMGTGCDPEGEDTCACYPVTNCCQPSDCTNDTACEWLETSTRVFRGCTQKQGHTASGGACTAATNDCESGLCAPFGEQTLCTDPCCQDSDCSSIPGGWLCRPLDVSLSVGAGMVNILICQPPASTVN